MSEGRTDPARADRADWVSVLSHESRTPLATVIAATRELCDRWESLASPQRSALLEIIAAQSEQLAELVAGRLGAVIAADALEPCDLGAIVRSAVAAARLAHTRVALDLVVPESLPHVSADASALGRVLTNLIDNAVEHGGGESIDLRVVLEDARVGVLVCDRGPGIAPGDQRMIFERGVRLAGAAPRAGGLGLWISRSIATAHGGTLEVHSALGVGATFTLWLPRVPTPS